MSPVPPWFWRLWASQRWTLSAIRPQAVVPCSQQTTGMYTNHKIDQDDHWQRFGTQPNLISAPQWDNRPCNAPTGFYKVGKKLPLKADLTTYSQAVDVCGQCMSELLILGHNLDFSSCDIMVSFCKPGHIYRHWAVDCQITSCYCYPLLWSLFMIFQTQEHFI